MIEFDPNGPCVCGFDAECVCQAYGVTAAPLESASGLPERVVARFRGDPRGFTLSACSAQQGGWQWAEVGTSVVRINLDQAYVIEGGDQACMTL